MSEDLAKLHAIAARLLPAWDARPDPGVAHLGEGSPGEQLDAVAAWLACPCEEHVEAALKTLPLLPQPALHTEHGEVPWAVAHDLAEAAVLAIRRPKFVGKGLALAKRLGL